MGRESVGVVFTEWPVIEVGGKDSSSHTRPMLPTGDSVLIHARDIDCCR